MKSSHLLAGLIATLTTASLHAANFNWNVAGPADWNNEANWLPDGGADNDRFVNNGGIATITANTTVPIRDTKIGVGGGTSGTVNHSAGVHANGAGNWTSIGTGGGNGTYNMADTSAGGGTYTGFAAGTGSHTNAGRLYVGDGAGSIGKFNMNTTGTMHLSNDLIVGINAGSSGTFNMDAGTVSSNGWTFVGQDGGTGTMRMSGGLLTANNRMYVGANNGNGTLIVSGGQIDATEMHIADNTDWGGAGGTANVTISGGIINAANLFQVGRLGAVGTVNQNGGQVNVNGGWFGIANDHVNSAGSSYTLSGGALNLNNGVNAEIGADTTGFMTVSSAGKLNGSGTVHVGFRNGGNGTLTVSGNGEVNAANGVSLGTNGGATGTLQGNGGTIFAPTIGKGAGTAQFNANGVTFKARSNQSEFLPGLNAANSELQSGGLKVDTNGFTIATNVPFDGAGGLTKQGSGTLTLSGPASTFSGATQIDSGILEAGANGSLGGTNNITINPGGTLLLSGAGTDRINDSATITMAGGTIKTNGASEFSSPGTGALTLMSSSIIDFAGGLSIMNFGDSSGASWTPLTTLSIYNWDGSFLGGGNTQLRFGSGSSALMASQLGQIKFYSDAGNTLINFGSAAFVGGLGEVTPVPEPSSVIVAVGLLGLAGAWERRKKGLARKA